MPLAEPRHQTRSWEGADRGAGGPPAISKSLLFLKLNVVEGENANPCSRFQEKYTGFASPLRSCTENGSTEGDHRWGFLFLFTKLLLLETFQVAKIFKGR